MAKILHNIKWEFNKNTQQNYDIEDLKETVTRWVNESHYNNSFPGWGRFTTRWTNKKTKSGTKIDIDHNKYIIGNIIHFGHQRYQVYLFKANPPTGRIYSVNVHDFKDDYTDLVTIDYDEQYETETYDPHLYGLGYDDDMIVLHPNTIVNSYTHVPWPEDSQYPIPEGYSQDMAIFDENFLIVDDPTIFNVGDQVFINQSRDKNLEDESGIGLYEFQTIINIDKINKKIYFDRYLTNTYRSYKLYVKPDYGEYWPHWGIIQVVRVPQFKSLYIGSLGSITAKEWDGFSGGYVIFRVQNEMIIEKNGQINVIGKGYESSIGPNYGAGNFYFGINYFYNSQYPWQVPGGGGSGGYYANYGYPAGSGAGYANDGGNGISNYGWYGSHGGHHKAGYTPGGKAILDETLLTICLGPSGGSGGRENAIGGRGSGCIILAAKFIINNGEIRADGITPICNGGSSSGAGIIIYCQNLEQYGTISCKGGDHSCKVEYKTQHEYSTMIAGKGSDGRLVLYAVDIKENENTQYFYGTRRRPSTIREYIKIGKLPFGLVTPVKVFYHIKSNPTSSGNISDWSIFKSLTLKRDYPTNQFPPIKDNCFRILISFDNRKTYYTFNLETRKWIKANLKDIEKIGISEQELEQIETRDYFRDNLFNFSSKSIDFILAMQTYWSFDSPKLYYLEASGYQRSWKAFGVKRPQKFFQIDSSLVDKFMDQE